MADWQTISMFVMAGTTLCMVIVTYRALKSDSESHKKDRETDARMHTYDHIISLSHLEAEYLGGLTAETKEALDKVKKERLETLKKEAVESRRSRLLASLFKGEG